MHVRGTSVAVFTRVSTAAREQAILFSSLYWTYCFGVSPLACLLQQESLQLTFALGLAMLSC
jgi:hypothetical protein